MIEALVTTGLGIIASFLMYKKGRIDGKKEKHEYYITAQIDKLVDLYNDWSRSAKDNGIHALSSLGLETLENDTNIRKAIEKIEITSGKNPFGSQLESISGVDLFKLFRFIRVKNINTLKVRLQEIVVILPSKNGHVVKQHFRNNNYIPSVPVSTNYLQNAS